MWSLEEAPNHRLAHKWKETMNTCSSNVGFAPSPLPPLLCTSHGFREFASQGSA